MSVGDAMTSDLFALVCPALAHHPSSLAPNTTTRPTSRASMRMRARFNVRLRRNGDFVAMKRRHEDVADQGE